MKPYRIKAVAWKESLHLLRDPRSLIMGIAIPMLMLFLFGYALNLDIEKARITFWDQSSSPQSRDFVSRFAASRYFSLVENSASYRDIEQAIDTRRAIIAIIIPPDFARTMAQNKETAVQAILDGSDANSATIVLAYAEGVTRQFSSEIIVNKAGSQGYSPKVAPVDLRPRAWFNTDLVSRHFIFPGLIAVIMMVIAALLTSLTVAREWETGTMEQLIATPLTGGEIIAGKLAPYIAIGVLDLVLCVVVGYYFFGVPLRGNLFLLFSLSLVFLVGAMALGVLISIVAKSQLLASQFALVATMLPAFLLSGFIFPIDNMPKPIQIFTNIITARHFVHILRGIYLKDSGFSEIYLQTVVLAIFSVVVLALAVKKFRKKID
ncbi:ABC transporter permease [Geobacter pelophilus]|uniref:ABC transporter permease n=1 Tax=Geoanaerobacter pelophilus TaxID=60036 RepID=A0AAW4L831_9BACT|nr:ABC transporter permease [Geoanaerobacter pelophilus]MBT0666317.1 ABC transporter permease [Geoanaerobacter pelophilus]